MKCKDCDSCRLGWFNSKPESYVCIGVKEPFVIENINNECTEYPEKNDNCMTSAKTNCVYIFGKQKPDANKQPKADAKRIAEAIERTKKYIRR